MQLPTLRLQRRRHSVTGLCLIACTSCLVTAAQSQPHRPRPPAPAPGWHGDIHRFHEHDWGVWRGGYWSLCESAQGHYPYVPTCP